MQYPGNWFGGKTRGSLSEKKKTFLARITDPNGKTLSKYFSFATNSEKKRMNDNAKKWLMNESDRLGI
jgi:hypothetical protein